MKEHCMKLLILWVYLVEIKIIVVKGFLGIFLRNGVKRV